MFHGALYLAQTAEPAAAAWALGVVAVVGGGGLIAGFLTFAAALAVSVTTLLIAASWVHPAGAATLDHVAAVLLIANAATLALLGPGAYSVDAYLFGRREIIIPHDRSHR